MVQIYFLYLVNTLYISYLFLQPFTMPQQNTNQYKFTIQGMHCSTCALSVTKYLQKLGASNIAVNPVTGHTTFSTNQTINHTNFNSSIQALGFSVATNNNTTPQKTTIANISSKTLFLITAPFTAVLMLHMLPHNSFTHFLHNAWLQFFLCLPPLFLGCWRLGKSAIASIKNGLPNMNVLIILGALAAFIYSVYGFLILKNSNYMFFETTAAIITFAFLGSYLEGYTQQKTNTQMAILAKAEKLTANMLAFDDNYNEQIFEVPSNTLRSGDLLLIKTGEQVPIDCTILSGTCTVNEALLTGEATPIQKTKKEVLLAGSFIYEGTIRAQANTNSTGTVLAGIVQMAYQAQAQKPAVQQLADKINGIFVPTVIAIALLTFTLNYFFTTVPFTAALMRAIAVLVIACPCAMGLATPATYAVGLSKGLRHGILFKNINVVSQFKKLQTIIFDKTGTLTQGKFSIASFTTSLPEADFKQIVYSLEKQSNHPIAIAICQLWPTKTPIYFSNFTEVKGEGLTGTTTNKDTFAIGSFSFIQPTNYTDTTAIYVAKNGVCIGQINLADTLRPETANVITQLKNHNYKIVLLSGDAAATCATVAKNLAITDVFANSSPANKLSTVTTLTTTAPTAMVGDGINDAPALAQATVGIAVNGASSIALQNADVVLLNNNLQTLPKALQIGKQIYSTLQQNLFWAFAYNLVAIPVAAFGLLTPLWGAITMAASDVVLGLSCIWFLLRKVK
jgi:P-type Cu+ transporter